MMIGVKSIALVVLALAAAALSLRSGALSLDHFTEITVASAFAIGLFAASAAALVAFGARPGTKSRAAVALRRGRPTLAIDLPRADPAVRELPSIVLRALLVAMFACLGLATFTTDATARIASVPADLSEPSRAAYCVPDEDKPVVIEAPAAPPPPPVDQAGCALVKRAYALGYAKSLGSCAPKAAPVVADAPKSLAKEVCERRELDEPFLHYTWRRLVETARGSSPIDAASTKVDQLATRVDYLPDLLADIKHSITGTPHGSHHIWITLPDPHPSSALHMFTGEQPCTSLFADLPLWPIWSPSSPPAAIVEHAIGQLLFATRFGTPAACSDYTFHWDAPRDACAKLAADPEAFLSSHDGLKPIRAVLDRRRRQVALRRLALALDHAPTLPAPPPASSVASVACFVVGGAAPSFSGRSVVVDGETLLLREATTPAIAGAGAGPLDLYAQLARLLAGASAPVADRSGAEPPIVDAASNTDFPLASLEPLVVLDPFVDKGVRTLLANPALVEVYPFDRHLHAFVEGFRRIYFAQRGRL